MNRILMQLLKCPICGMGMAVTEDERVCKCLGPKTHCYDFARSGHLHLGGPHAGEGDSKEAVQARRAFLDAGYYQPLSDRICEILNTVPSATVLDAGCGEGYYTNRMASESRAVLGVDLSRAGVESAAKRAKQQGKNAAFTVASIFSLPVQSLALDAVVNIFAPCAENEFLRVLKPGGHLLVVGAGERHLMGLKSAIYDNPYENQARADLPIHMELISRQRLQTEITVVGQENIRALFSMTPYYWRTSKHDFEKLNHLEKLTTEVDFDIFFFKKKI